MTDFYRTLVNETIYGTDCIVLDDPTIREFLDWKSVESTRVNESSKVQGVYSDEGLYDFFIGFDEYKKVTDFKAKQILGWPVVDYILDGQAQDPFYELNMMLDDGAGMKGRADSVSYGGAVLSGDINPDRKYMKEMETIIDELGWEIIRWMGVGPNRKSKVAIIPSKDLDTMSAKVNEDIAVTIKYNEAAWPATTAEEFGADPGLLPSPSRKGINKAKKRKDRSVYSEENKIEKIVAIYPGRFQPFGPHHKKVYDFLKKRFDNVYIATSNKSGGSRHPMNFAMKKKHMQKMGVPGNAIVSEPQPYIPKKILGKYNPKTTAVVFTVGSKDSGRLSGGKYFKDYRKNYNRLQGFEKHGYTIRAPHISVRVGGQEIDGTTMRKLLGSQKYDIDIKKKFFKKMFGYWDQKTFDHFVGSFKENIILEGGAYGHMAHPFDDYNLTFGDLKSIIDQGLQGKLDKEEAVTEKLDGQNIMVSVIDGSARAARNKGQLKSGGLTLDGVKNMFKHHIPTVRSAFVYSMTDLKSSLERMPKKDQELLFDNGKNWANIEIIYPDTKNVIDYDGGAQIIFHGILKYDDKWTPRGQVKSGGAKVSKIINKINKGIKTKFAFKGPNVLNITKSKNYEKMRSKFFSSLSKLQNIYRLKDTDEVSLYHQHFWLEYILAGANSTDFSNIPDNILYPLMKRWAFSDKSYKMTDINKLKEDHPKFVDWVRTTEKLDHAKMLKNNMRPFEVLFFKVGAEILSNVNNWLAPNPNKTVQSLRTDIAAAEKQIRGSKDASAIGKLKTQLSKIATMGDLNKLVPSEGLVFKYKGKVYKFTGFFAPINQITGLMKFAR